VGNLILIKNSEFLNDVLIFVFESRQTSMLGSAQQLRTEFISDTFWEGSIVGWL
jgi:hypothetical protein